MSQQTTTFRELQHALELDPWWGFIPSNDGPKNVAPNAERVVEAIEQDASTRVREFLIRWSRKPCKGHLHAKLIRLLCVSANLPAYTNKTAARKPERQSLDWRPPEYAERWRQKDIAIRLDELRHVLERNHLPLPERFFGSRAFLPLAKALDGWFDKTLAALPIGLRLRVAADFAPSPWDPLSAEQRRTRAMEWDYQNHPETEQERQRYFDLQVRHEELEAKLRDERQRDARTPSEAEKKEQRIAEIEGEVDEVAQALNILDWSAQIAPCHNDPGYLPLAEAFNLLAGQPEGTTMRTGHPLRRLWDSALSAHQGGAWEVAQCRNGCDVQVSLVDLLSWAEAEAVPLGLTINTPPKLAAEREERKKLSTSSQADIAARDERIREIEALLARFAAAGLQGAPGTISSSDRVMAGFSDDLSRFRSMEALTFDEVAFKVDPDNLKVQVEARELVASVAFHVLGLTKKNGFALNAQGQEFMAIARGDYDPADKGKKRRIDRLGKALRHALGMTENPFPRGRPKFTAHIPKDSRAKREAKRRQVTFDDGRIPGATSNGSDWLRANDPAFDPNDPTYTDEDG
ncbi:hypothetical protein [Thioalkalivibrio sp. ALE9]|uniref:hypothetical protein n=1 Tax=Thioalkalivibrio sp. ALE9 TaxID=1158169 RepID=UPI0003A6DD6E|nr:hypothetical protein [Thioalkalivibrio sp. ALE9]